MNNTKVQALLATAEAFYRRGNALQYDQRSMDRLVQVTPRRNKLASPEEATSQHTLFLDCSAFVNACYYNTFGQILESDLTWQIQDMVKPMVYDYTLTHRETAEEKERIREEMMAILQPGDVLNMWYADKVGHVILIGENGMYYHCTGHGHDPSYHYADCCDEITEHGGVYYESMAQRFEPTYFRSMLGEKMERITVLRPLQRMGEPTANATVRLHQAKNLFCAVLSSVPGGQTVRPDTDVTYSVQITNDGDESCTLNLSALPGEGCIMTASLSSTAVLSPRETAVFPFTVRYTGEKRPYAPAPVVTVNGLNVWAERFLLQWGEESSAAIPSRIPAVLDRLFLRYDTPNGDVLWRKEQNPWEDQCLYSFFGGTGVITPEIGQHRLIRTCRITRSDLCPGDMILCSDDALYQHTYAYLVTAEGLTGDEQQFIGEEADQLIDSLPGRFCYIVQRPAIKKN